MSYLPLNNNENEIRLLQLYAGSSDDVIRCNLLHTILDSEVPCYEALSYVWGSLDNMQSIVLENSLVPITSSLHQALKAFRFSSKMRVLWVDALCIDQSCVEERNAQVQILGRIYRTASNVIIWLGESWPFCDMAMSFWKQLGEDRNLHPFSTSTPYAKVDEHSLDSDTLRSALVRFFTLPWWTRIWTVQEFVLAQRGTVHCGDDSIDTSIARQAVRNFFDHQTSQTCSIQEWTPQLAELFTAFYAMDSLNYTSQLLENTSLLYNTAQYRTRKATNLRDKIYGILGLGSNRTVRPNYALSVEAAYEEAAVASIEITGELEVLSYLATFDEERNTRLPSFVPDWSLTKTDPRTYPDWLNWIGHLNLYNACNGNTARYKCITSGKL